MYSSLKFKQKNIFKKYPFCHYYKKKLPYRDILGQEFKNLCSLIAQTLLDIWPVLSLIQMCDYWQTIVKYELLGLSTLPYMTLLVLPVFWSNNNLIC